jgi:hypothetical protein
LKEIGCFIEDRSDLPEERKKVFPELKRKILILVDYMYLLKDKEIHIENITDHH